eukprot:3546775-Amphidinium_carterae.1
MLACLKVMYAFAASGSTQPALSKSLHNCSFLAVYCSKVSALCLAAACPKSDSSSLRGRSLISAQLYADSTWLSTACPPFSR